MARRVVAPDGGSIATWDADGTGHRFFLAHATGFCAGAWAAVIGELADAAMTLWDFRGHGMSDPGSIPTSWWEMAGDVAAVRDSTRAHRAIGVGHSMGGAALVMAQLSDRARFDALVLVEPIILPPPYRRDGDHPLARLARKRRRIFHDLDAVRSAYRDRLPFATWDERAFEGYVSDGFRPTAEGVVLSCEPEFEAELYTAAGAHALLNRLGEIEVPVAIVLGAESDTYPSSWGERLAAGLPRAELEVISGAGHFVPMERPAALAAIVKRMSLTVG